jgi:hypothetical protein
LNESAIVTLAIGEKQLTYWRNCCERTWRAYAEKQRYDVIVVSEPLDTSSSAASRSPAWQKCLVLSQAFAAKYRQIVVLDSDIIINAQIAPRITDQVPVGAIGAIVSGSHILEDLRPVLLSRLRRTQYDYERGRSAWKEDQDNYYRQYGLDPHPAGILQTGVLVASPQHHRSLFEGVYTAAVSKEHRTFEQVPLSHMILNSGQFRQIDTRFNSVFYETMLVHYPYLNNTQTPSYELLASCALQTEYANNFFLHFAYIPHFVQFLPDIIIRGDRASDVSE